MTIRENVIVLDDKNVEIGIEDKLIAHYRGIRHRAFSIFVLDSSGRTLIQKRASSKYHSADLWSNTCCSHPSPGEQIEHAAHRKLQQEMGFDCELAELFNFSYAADLGHGLFENEHDHVFVGRFDGSPSPNPEEVQEWNWVALDKLRDDVKSDPGRFTYWLAHCMDELMSTLKQGGSRLASSDNGSLTRVR